MRTHKVRTTIQPHVELTVGEAEYTDLQRNGLLYEGEPPAAPEPDPDPPKETRGRDAASKKGD